MFCLILLRNGTLRTSKYVPTFYSKLSRYLNQVSRTVLVNTFSKDSDVNFTEPVLRHNLITLSGTWNLSLNSFSFITERLTYKR